MDYDDYEDFVEGEEFEEQDDSPASSSATRKNNIADPAFMAELKKVKGAIEMWNNMSPKEQNSFKVQYKQIQKHLKKAKERVFDVVNCPTKLTFSQKVAKTLAKSRKFKPFFKKEVEIIERKLRSNIVKNISSKGMSGSPILMYVLIGVVFIFLIVAVIAFVGSIMPWLFPDDENPDGGSVNSVFGVTGNDFYGVRMVYSDPVKAKNKMIEDYISFINEGAETFSNTTTITIDETTYNLTLNLNHLALPGEDYDYSQFDEVVFLSDYAKLHELTFKIAKENYKVDNGAEYSGTFLEECVDGVKYFGYSNLPLISEMVAEDIVTPESINAVDGEGNQASDAILEDIEEKIEEQLVQNYNSKYSSVRTEKLFVKDYILDGDDAKVSGITKENYVALIFMNKKQVSFKNISFAVGNADLTNFTISIDGASVSTDGNNLGTEEKQSYIYGTGNINISSPAFEDIDTNNLNALSEGVSLLDIVQTVSDSSIYLETITDENSVEILRLKRNGVVVNLFNSEAFSIVEWETSWE